MSDDGGPSSASDSPSGQGGADELSSDRTGPPGSESPGRGEASPEPRDSDGYLRWPPPGLERLQGDLWEVIRKTALGGALMVLPLLGSIAAEQPFWSFGPLEESWWVVLVVSLVGLLVLGGALVALFRLFRRAARASERGYDRLTIAEVAADGGRDMGFLIQGARAYSTLPARRRRQLVQARLTGAGAYLAAALWLPLAFSVSIFLAGRDLLGTGPTLWVVLGPAALLLLAGLVARILDTVWTRDARAQWHQKPWSEDLVRDDIRSWQSGISASRDELGLASDGPGTGRLFKVGAAAALGVAALVAVSTVSLLFLSGISPVLTEIAVPRFSTTQERVATAAPYRQYRLEPDGDVTPAEAGEALHALARIGRTNPVPEQMRPPERTYAAWFPDDTLAGGNPLDIPGQDRPVELIRRAASGFDADERSFLSDVAAHPAHREFTTMARAGAADVVGGRYELPFPEDMATYELAIPSFGGFRDGAYARVARAAFELSQGRIADAERTLRELITAGFVLADDAPTLIDNLIGFVTVEIGGRALLALYETAGLDRKARQLRHGRRISQEAVEATRTETRGSPAAWTREMAEIVTDSTRMRGLRWELFTSLSHFAPCLNMHRVVFGPGRSYREWVEDARRSLVRYEGEEALFEMFRRARIIPPTESGEFLGRLLTFPVSDRRGPGSCSAMFGLLEPVIG